MLTKTSLVVFCIFLGQLGYIVMSYSRKNQNIDIKKKKIHAFANSVVFSRFLYILKYIFILIPYSMGSYLKYYNTLFQVFL